MSGLVRWDSRVNGVVLVRVTLDHGLNHMVHMVVFTLVDDFSLVNNHAVLSQLLVLVVVAVQTSQDVLILVSIDVALVDFSSGHYVLMVLLVRVLGITNRLNVVLNVVQVTVDVTLPLDLLGLVYLVLLLFWCEPQVPSVG